MCGILGIYGDGDTREEFAQRLLLLAHRGPDAYGIHEAEAMGATVRLGHRRLSIIDVSASANQPMQSGDLVITFNGEIYNYRELRSELGALGVIFRTHSDTEVILEGWRRWGPKVLPRLRGMFAFAIYDRASQELHLARDPFGIKPLYYTLDGNSHRLAFASELKAIRGCFGSKTLIDPAAFCASLLYVWIPENFCIYKGYFKLTPGTHARFHPHRGLSISRFWSVDDLPKGDGLSIDDLGDVIADSVRAHMVADVPVGTFLSGGLDSSLVTMIAAEHSSTLECFTIGYGAADARAEAMPDDLIYARRLAKKHGLILHEIAVDPNIGASLDRLIDLMDEPIGDPAQLNVLAICDAARARGIKVLLSGQGADELFMGYRRHQAALIARYWRHMPASLRTPVAAMANCLPVALGGRGLRKIRWAKRFFSFAALDEEAAYRRSYSYFDPTALDRLTKHSLTSAIDSIVTQHAECYARGGDAPTRAGQIRRMSITDLQMFLPSLNLAYTDRASMAMSTEVRTPYVDTRVVDAAFRLNADGHLRRGVQKIYLKNAAERWLDRDIICRPKANFGLPLRAWTRRQLRERLYDLLPNGQLVQDGWLDGREVGNLLKLNTNGTEDLAQAVWHLMTLEMWYRREQKAPHA